MYQGTYRSVGICVVYVESTESSAIEELGRWFKTSLTNTFSNCVWSVLNESFHQ